MINKMDLVKELRALTQAGMSDCKAALEECEYDLQKAIDAVKAKGLNNTTRNAGKVAAEGVVDIAKSLNGDATMVEINCQTDFVAKSPAFLEFATTATALFSMTPFEVLAKPFSLTELVLDGKSLEDSRKEVMASTKENVLVRRWVRFEAGDPSIRVFSYLHGNARLGVLLKLQATHMAGEPDTGVAETPEFKQLGEELAMQIAAMSPLAVSRDQLAPEEIERQRGIFETQLTEAKKPQAAWPKIMEGKFNKWYTDVCLLDQESVITAKTSVAQVIANLEKRLATHIKVVEFQRLAVGEGVEVKKENYGDEIAKLTGIAAETENPKD